MPRTTHGAIDWLGTVFASPLKGEALDKGVAWTFAVAGIASLILAAFSLTLPHTPPKPKAADSEDRFAWLEAVRLLKHPFMLVLWIVTLVDAFVHNCFFNWSATFSQERPGRHPGKLDHAGPEPRPDRRDTDDVYPRRHAQATGLESDHDHRHPRPRCRGSRSLHSCRIIRRSLCW